MLSSSRGRSTYPLTPFTTSLHVAEPLPYIRRVLLHEKGLKKKKKEEGQHSAIFSSKELEHFKTNLGYLCVLKACYQILIEIQSMDHGKKHVLFLKTTHTSIHKTRNKEQVILLQDRMVTMKFKGLTTLPKPYLVS